MPITARKYVLRYLLVLFLILSGGSTLAMFVDMVLIGIILLISALVFLAGLVILLLLPLFDQLF